MHAIMKAGLLLGLLAALCSGTPVYQAIYRGTNASANSVYSFEIDLTALSSYPTLYLSAKTFQFSGGQMLDGATDSGSGIDSQIWLFSGSLGNLLATSFITGNDDINLTAGQRDSQLLGQAVTGGNQYILALTLHNNDFRGSVGSPITAGFYSAGQWAFVGDRHYAVQIWATPDATPEPSTYVLIASGLVAMVLLSRRIRGLPPRKRYRVCNSVASLAGHLSSVSPLSDLLTAIFTTRPNIRDTDPSIQFGSRR